MIIKQVSPTLWRGTRPATQADYNNLKARFGVTNTVNLERGWFEFFTGTTNRDTMMALRAGITPIRIEMSDFSPPTKEQLDAFLIAVAKGPTFVHCLTEVDRTGMSCAYYRVKVQNWPVEEAIKEMHAMGMHWWYRKYWTAALREYCV